MHKFIIRGTRGSVPACGRDFLKYGGNTTCFTLETDQGLVIFDAGTGIMSLNRELISRPTIPPVTVMFTHFHLDHLIGLPLFAPLYNPTVPMTLMADGSRKEDWKAAIKGLIGAPYWPGELMECGGPKELLDLPEGNGPVEIYGVKISWCPVFHPQGCLAYKIELPESTIVIATDHEHAPSDISAGFLEFCRNADSLIYDAMYTPSEYLTHSGWGHGNWEQGVQLAMEAGAKELILTHHDYKRTDADIDDIVSEAQKYFPNTRGATESMVLASSSVGVAAAVAV